jgi:RNA polymerase sigma factor (sigma-70 family)
MAFEMEYWYKFQHFAMDYSSLSCDELFRVCVDPGNIEAWQEFVRRFNPLIKVTVWRVSCRYGVTNGPLIEDLTQETYTKICHNNFHLLRTFKSDHPNACFGMIKIVARNVSIDHFRKPDPIQSD